MIFNEGLSQTLCYHTEDVDIVYVEQVDVYIPHQRQGSHLPGGSHQLMRRV